MPTRSSQPRDANGDPQPDVLRDVSKPLKAYLHGIRGYVYHQETVLKDPVTLSNCIPIDPDDFDTYRASSAFIVFHSRTIPQPLVSKPSRRSPAEEFDRGIKLDANLYPTLSDDKQWDSYRRNLEATCRTHGLKQVLDPKYQPTSLDERDLFDRHQSFLYQVFVRTLLTDQGKKIVRQYDKTYDATDVVTTGDLEPDPGPPMFDFNIDMDLGNYYAYRTSLSSARKTFLPNKLWQQLDDQGQRAWHQLPEAAKAVILGGSNKPLPPPPPPCMICRPLISFLSFSIRPWGVM
ncbi:unnamed protein product [Cylindrotheca closterium]|uniref:Uncharacterized protein n=1 Tax=Cylindrotheca closterium TaxID=2856 RepID=A0AAD2JN22_9STRA|nr:unnamed protein product [Cylindrotheca closterium]